MDEISVRAQQIYTAGRGRPERERLLLLMTPLLLFFQGWLDVPVFYFYELIWAAQRICNVPVTATADGRTRMRGAYRRPDDEAVESSATTSRSTEPITMPSPTCEPQIIMPLPTQG